MKYFPANIPNILDKINNTEIRAMLLYGPDKGLISNALNLLEKNFSSMTSSISYSEWNDACVDVLLNTNNFLNNRELIKITNVTEGVTKNTKRLAQEQFIHFPIFIANELKSTSPIRKFFEDNKSLAIIACYYDEQLTNKYIKSTLEQHKKTITSEAFNNLLLNCRNDFALIKNELQKLLYYVGDKSSISLEDVTNTISNNLSIGLDELCINFSKKNLCNFLLQLKKLLLSGINEIMLIRSLLKYYLNMYIVIDQINKGHTVDTAIKQLSPPIFFKHIPDFKMALNKHNKHEVIRVIKLLQTAEIEYKSNNKTFDLYQQLYSCFYA